MSESASFGRSDVRDRWLPRVTALRERLRGLEGRWREREGRSRYAGPNPFAMNPPAEESDLLTFEERNQVHLPEDYRRFLLEVGNGGAGPFYGLEPLPTSARPPRPKKRKGVLPALGALASPFPFEEDVECPPQEQLDRLGPPAWGWYQGTLDLCSMGCGDFYFLIVSGPARGQVINVGGHCTVSVHFAEERDFLAWYKSYLDRVVRGENVLWSGRDAWRRAPE